MGWVADMFGRKCGVPEGFCGILLVLEILVACLECLSL